MKVRCFSPVGVAVFFFLLVTMGFADQRYGIIKGRVTLGNDFPLVNSVVTVRSEETGSENVVHSDKTGVFWAVLPIGGKSRITVESGRRSFSTGVVLDSECRAQIAHLSFLQNGEARWTLAPLPSEEYCRAAILTEPFLPNGGFQLLQTDVAPFAIWVFDGSLNRAGRAELFLGRPSSWRVRVYSGKKLVGEGNFNILEHMARRNLTVRVPERPLFEPSSTTP